MIGDAVPIRFSRRINRKSNLSPIKWSSNTKIRRTVKKRTCGINSSSLKTREKSKVGKKSESKGNCKQTSKCLKQASCNLKTDTNNRRRKKASKTCNQKRKIKNSINTSQIDLPINEVPLKNHFFELSDGKKNYKKLSNHGTFRFLKSLPSLKKKEREKELNHCSLKSSKERKLSQKESSIQVTNLSSKSVLTPNPENVTLVSKHSERKKSARLKHSKRKTSAGLSKSLTATPVSENVTNTSRHSQNRKSESLSKEPDQLRIMKSTLSLCTFSFQSYIATPHLEKNSERRKSLRLLKPCPISTLNNELSSSTSASLPGKSLYSVKKKSATLDKNAELISFKSSKRKRGRPKASDRDILTISYGELKQRQRVGQHQKTSKIFKKPLSTESENLPFDVLVKPAFKPVRVRTLSKPEPKPSNCPFNILTASSLTPVLSKSDPKSSKRKLNVSGSEIHVVNEKLQDAKRKKSADFPNVPGKGTLKRKRWLLNNLKEKNECYEDDLFENYSFNLKSSLQFGDESDGSSVNIATPKFDCILTPALPRKTPRFKDCISPSELSQARKSAEEYLFRRNKKRKSGDKPSSSEKKTKIIKKNAVQDCPEKKKLDFEEAVNKLIEVQRTLEMEAEVDEEEDSYFSDASN